MIDTSVWIDFFRGAPSRETALLKNCLGQWDHVFITGVIAQEVLQGIRDDSLCRSVREYLVLFDKLGAGFFDYIEAANIYRTLRKAGLTISNPMDCLIAVLAIRHDVFLLHKDSDFTLISQHCPLSIVA